MDFASKMQHMRDLQAEINRMVSDLNKELLDAIESENKKDVTPTCENPQVAIVPYSKVMATPGHILSPDYYLPGSQVEAVRHKVNHSSNVCKAVLDMIADKKVKMNCGYIHLNETTLRVLRESQLGQFVIAESAGANT